VQSGATFALGTHTITETATDAHNNSSMASFTITVQDTTPPVVSIQSVGGLINNPNQTISGTATDTVAVGATVLLYDNSSSSALATATVGADGKWTTPVVLSGDGTHTIVAKDKDASGNTGTSSPVVFTLDQDSTETDPLQFLGNAAG
jgi:hypothetical protein